MKLKGWRTTINDIIERLKKINIPMTEMEFENTEENPPPPPPYLIYLITHEVSRGADFNENLIKEISMSIELYTDKFKNEAIEKSIESIVLFDIKYDKYQATIQSEELVQTAYEFKILSKK